MSSSSVSLECPKCGCTLAQDAPRGLCAKCLISGILDSGPISEPMMAGRGALPREFGAYTLLEEIARGGMGIVYRARQQQIHRTVALKVLVSGQFAAPDVVDRFRIEADATASLDHPNIVPVYEAGECEGQPFFSMKLIEGRSLAHRLASLESPMPQREAAEMLAKLARAVHYAHQRGILHRDIKPGNVLLDVQGEPYLTDFGLARLVEDDNQLTRTMAMLGTPAYMAPEQARGEAKGLTTAVDVYGLGAVFYELLTGRPPFAGGTAIETVRQVLDKEPRWPSAVRPGLDRDLETICVKCLNKDPARRYGSAEALAADLERWQRHEPILARPIAGLERSLKWIKRHLAAFFALTAIIVLLVAGLAVSSWLAVEATNARKEEVKQRIEAEAARAEAEEHQKTAEAATKQAEANLNRAEWLVYAGKVMLAQASFDAGNGGLALHHLEQCRPDLRGWEWHHLWSRINPILTLKTEGYPVSSVAFSPDGSRIAAVGEHGMVKIWDAATGRQLYSSAGQTVKVRSVAFSDDSRFFVTASDDGTAKIREVAGREIHTLKGHTAIVRGATFSPDGKRIVTGSDDGTARVWSAGTGEELFRLTGLSAPVLSVDWSTDGGRIVTGGVGGRGMVWDAATGQPLVGFGEGGHTMLSVAFRADGKRIVSGGEDGTAKVRDAATGQLLLVFKGHRDAVISAVFSPDGTCVLTGSRDQTAILWDAEAGGEHFRIRGHTGAVQSVVFNPDGKRIITGGTDSTVKVWDALRGQEVLTLKGHQNDGDCIAFSPDSRRIAASGRNNTVRVWDMATDREVLVINMSSSAANREKRMAGVNGVDFSPDGKRIVGGGEDETARVWDAFTGEELVRLHHGSGVSSVAFSPDGRRILTGFGGWVEGAWGGDRQPGEARMWDAGTGRELFSLKGHTGLLTSVAFSPDGTRIATGSWDHTAKVWDAATGRELFTLKGHAKYVWSVAFSPDSRRIVTGSFDKGARVWDASSGREIFTLQGHTDNVRGVAFSPDGTRIVTCSDDRTAKIWDGRTGLELFTTGEHVHMVWSVAISPDGLYLATGTVGAASGVKVWSAAPTVQTAAKEQEEKTTGE
jgi:WD40 repeat protein/predicted Ser/Thr protein kinase